MAIQTATEEYALALRRGQKEQKEWLAAGKRGHPLVLDELLQDSAACAVQELGVVEVPAGRIVGTKSAGRITSFSPSFMPLLEPGTEFATKWIQLCAAHLSDAGIREPITCYEYLGNFYVEEGNKRVSVLRYFEAPRIPGSVRRIVPPQSKDPRIIAYYEFLEFYKASKLYDIQFRRPGDYDKLQVFLGKAPGEPWTEMERRTFNAYYHYFLTAFEGLNVRDDLLPEEALLLWLKVHSYQNLGELSAGELKRSLLQLRQDMIASTKQSEVKVKAEPEAEEKPGILSRIITAVPDHVKVAFVHQLNPATSSWVLGHEEGRKYIEKTFGSKISVHSYYDANTQEEAEERMEQAVAEGAQVIFTTAPKLSRITLKFAVKYPKLHFLNCSVDQPYSSIRTYYGRIYEAKFITGAIAGAMAQDDRIGYIGSNPIFGVPASINAFALGAQMVNPRAQIELRWSCCAGTPQADFFSDGIRVVSNRDVPTQDKMYLEFCNYGTYILDDQGGLIPLASPVWVWGKFYETVIRAVFSGIWREGRQKSQAVNYWLGIDSGVIDIRLADRLPEGVRTLANLLRRDMSYGGLDPFFRRIVAQDGTVKNDGTRRFTPDELLHMDWLCENVVGQIPEFRDILPMSQSLVRELGIYRDRIPAAKEI